VPLELQPHEQQQDPVQKACEQPTNRVQPKSVPLELQPSEQQALVTQVIDNQLQTRNNRQLTSMGITRKPSNMPRIKQKYHEQVNLSRPKLRSVPKGESISDYDRWWECINGVF